MNKVIVEEAKNKAKEYSISQLTQKLLSEGITAFIGRESHLYLSTDELHLIGYDVVILASNSRCAWSQISASTFMVKRFIDVEIKEI